MSLKSYRSFLIIFLILFLSGEILSQTTQIPDYKSYIEKFKSIAIEEMLIYKIPASITLAQGIIESNCGLSPLASEANNHFGIKCHKDWTGERFYYDDDEEHECFRKYNNAEDSYRDHSIFLSTRPRYAALFSLDSNDYTGWAMGLKQAGYATNPQYPAILIRLIETHNLSRFDKLENSIAKLEKDPVQDPAVKEEYIDKISDSRLFKEGYKTPAESLFKIRRTTESGRKVYENNGIPFIYAKQGDTWYGIAKEFGIFAFQVYKDNDMLEMDVLTIGQIIYLEPKKRRGVEDTFIVKKTDSMYSISQETGVKLKLLLKYNDMLGDEDLNPGQVIHLRNQDRFLF
ncbi:MAG: glucosaminidase domain-containing protein [Bacteroidales bacterium]|nr:glucosaminidase domain-containing protein [Bacteroidales bacterium]